MKRRILEVTDAVKKKRGVVKKREGSREKKDSRTICALVHLDVKKSTKIVKINNSVCVAFLLRCLCMGKIGRKSRTRFCIFFLLALTSSDRVESATLIGRRGPTEWESFR